MPRFLLSRLSSKCKEKADELRKSHNEKRLEATKKRNDDEAIREIEPIITKEQKRKDWAPCHAVHGKSRGRAVVAVQTVDSDGAVHTHSTKESVEAQAAAELNPRFRLSASAPIFSSPLIEHTGILGDKPAVREILNGTFQYPEGTDEWTMAIMQEACSVFQQLSPESIVTLV